MRFGDSVMFWLAKLAVGVGVVLGLILLAVVVWGGFHAIQMIRYQFGARCGMPFPRLFQRSDIPTCDRRPLHGGWHRSAAATWDDSGYSLRAHQGEVK